MESVASNNTQAVTKNCQVFAGRNKATFHEYKSKLRVCLSLYSKPVFEFFQGKVQPSSTLSSADTDTSKLGVIAEGTWTQANQNLRYKTRATIEVHQFFSEVPQLGSLRHVLLNPKECIGQKENAAGYKIPWSRYTTRVMKHKWLFPTILG